VTTLRSLTRDRHVLICAGPGGVGKTTLAAAMALEGARLGRRACVVTIDPAKRLADALGLEALTNEAHRVEGDWSPGGELWALMLDTKTTFDDVVVHNAGSPQQAQAILDNRLYRNISGALGGTQEYMAMEKLYELHQEGRFDLIVVDTPPTRHALDFLDAPARLARFLDNRMFRLLMMPTRASLRALSVATRLFLRTVSSVVGQAMVADTVAFFAAFEGMEQGFRDRAARVEVLLADEGTAFVVVAAPRRDAVTEALYFADRLRDRSERVGALVVNRMFPFFGAVPEGVPRTARAKSGSAGGGGTRGGGAPTGGAPAGGGSGEGGCEGGAAGLGRLIDNLAQLNQVASREEQHVATLAERLPGATVVRVPFLADDIHDIAGLTELGGWLFGPSAGEG
jgi:anion-transporting  ArsA/GET3 family ATPase